MGQAGPDVYGPNAPEAPLGGDDSFQIESRLTAPVSILRSRPAPSGVC
jgi:hypothetical protein